MKLIVKHIELESYEDPAKVLKELVEKATQEGAYEYLIDILVKLPADQVVIKMKYRDYSVKRLI